MTFKKGYKQGASLVRGHPVFIRLFQINDRKRKGKNGRGTQDTARQREFYLLFLGKD